MACLNVRYRKCAAKYSQLSKYFKINIQSSIVAEVTGLISPDVD